MKAMILLMAVICVGCGGKTFEKELKETSENLNKDCPKMIDEVTRIDRTTASGNQLNYFYTLINFGEAELAQAGGTRSLESALRAQMTDMYRSHPDMSVFRENNVVLSYHYHYGNGEPIFVISISPSDF